MRKPLLASAAPAHNSSLFGESTKGADHTVYQRRPRDYKATTLITRLSRDKAPSVGSIPKVYRRRKRSSRRGSFAAGDRQWTRCLAGSFLAESCVGPRCALPSLSYEGTDSYSMITRRFSGEITLRARHRAADRGKRPYQCQPFASKIGSGRGLASRISRSSRAREISHLKIDTRRFRKVPRDEAALRWIENPAKCADLPTEIRSAQAPARRLEPAGVGPGLLTVR
ncbi:uncharacterized protein LOC118648508 [Monomorium pharaonis]|uniref:uncharacterized protein LOC118648508 n=1 Tax=Monomorium pharaonis TaxID=307658 RepID=UPI00174682F4|nr:uncharacterized protein LOC118648508 [Monomorium pharaonis]